MIAGEVIGQPQIGLGVALLLEVGCVDEQQIAAVEIGQHIRRRDGRGCRDRDRR